MVDEFCACFHVDCFFLGIGFLIFVVNFAFKLRNIIILRFHILHSLKEIHILEKPENLYPHHFRDVF